MRILSIFGTRPEAIKMGPVVRELERHPGEIESVVCVTAQHREMLDQVLDLFEIRPRIDLGLMEENQNPTSLTAFAIHALTEVLEKVQPDFVLVQGDTTTAMVAGLAAFYGQIPVGHVEAGLRTYARYHPFPEEMNRRLLGALATYHFAPTERAFAALRREGVPKENIFVTGNPVIDALRWISSRPPAPATVRFLTSLGLDPGQRPSRKLRTLLVTVHRRESFGGPLADICRALKSLVQRNPDVQIVFPVHLNPNVRETVFGLLSDEPRIHLVDPLPYETLVRLMGCAYLIVTDSGGLQEEGPAVGKPVLILREETERPEGVEAGTARIVSRDPAVIVEETERLLHDPEAYRRMACAVSPYGDGHAAERIVQIIREHLPERRPL
ncbi:MAG: non-hydrolyzing UDP-N-acetylglucosamine 2-epimerase [Candidatus Methylomirabilales bacterium]